MSDLKIPTLGCAHNHRTHEIQARCMWRKACWVKGEGRFAVVSCRNGWKRVSDRETVTLHPTAEEALATLQGLNQLGCGGRCHQRHEVYRVRLLTEFMAELGE